MELPKRKPNRLKTYDYASSGIYFLTICTKKQEHVLGDVVGAVSGRPSIQLSYCGKILEEAIAQIPEKYPHIKVDKYVIMPNHVHLLIYLSAEGRGRPMTAPTVSWLVNQMKGYVSKKVGYSIWQKSFHDHIVRNEESYRKIWEYIDSNPDKWELDCYYKQ